MMREPFRCCVFGPAYLDHVIELDRPLAAPELLARHLKQSLQGGYSEELDRYIQCHPLTVDWSVAASEKRQPPRPGLYINSPDGDQIEITLPSIHPGEPDLEIRLAEAIVQSTVLIRYLETFAATENRGLLAEWPVIQPLILTGNWKSIGIRDDLGGMGAGYAAALGGELLYACGAEPDGSPDAIGRRVRDDLLKHGARVTIAPVRGCASDETLLLSTRHYGDKLPIGFRDAVLHYPLERAARLIADSELVIIASLPNQAVARLLEHSHGRPVLFAPAMRNVTGQDFPVNEIQRTVSCMTLNENEWRRIRAKEELRETIPLLFITRGAAGVTACFRNESGARESLDVPAHHPEVPPKDTNRAGETFAAFTLRQLIRSAGIDCLISGRFRRGDIEKAARHGSVAAHLQLQREDFGFPTEAEVEMALKQSQ